MNSGAAPEARVLSPFADFREAAEATLGMLRARSGLPIWLFTRNASDDWLVLAAATRERGPQVGDPLHWNDHVQVARLGADGPCFRADLSDAGVECATPHSGKLHVGAYLGVPVRLDGGVLGVLSAMSTEPVAAAIGGWLPVAEVCARALATLWVHSADLDRTRRRAERAELEAMTDPMTEVYNRRGWQRILALEEARCRDGDGSAGVIVVDLDELKKVNDRDGHDAGDALILAAAGGLQRSIRPGDALARLGGDEFALLLVDVGPTELVRAAHRVERELAATGISATVGCSWRGPGRDLGETCRDADQMLIDAKRARRPTLR